MTSRRMRLICRTLLAALLFAQVAIAAHACPGWPGGSARPDAMTATSGQEIGDAQPTQAAEATRCEDMAGAMDPLFAALCAAHCQSDEQGSQTSGLSVPIAWLVSHHGIDLWPGQSRVPRRSAAEVGARVAVAPSHAILHCCFRL